MRTKGIDWTRCVGICTDEAKLMRWKHTGLIAHIRKICPSIHWLHYSVHREALAAKNMPVDLPAVLLNSILFTLLCNEMGSEHKALLLHTEVRWLSRGKVLTRLSELRHELLRTIRFIWLSVCMTKTFWRLAYLVDIFSVLNELNLSLQGVSVSVQHTRQHQSYKKATFWAGCVRGNTLLCFPTLHEFLGEKVPGWACEKSHNWTPQPTRRAATKMLPTYRHISSMDSQPIWSFPPGPTAVIFRAGTADPAVIWWGTAVAVQTKATCGFLDWVNAIIHSPGKAGLVWCPSLQLIYARLVSLLWQQLRLNIGKTGCCRERFEA